MPLGIRPGALATTSPRVLTYLAHEGVPLRAVAALDGGEGEGGALAVVEVVDPHAVAELEPLVLALYELVQVLQVVGYVRH